jgi:NADH-quinone oxidoreductase subunit J
MFLEYFFFFLLSGIAIVSAIGMISMKDPVHSALLLVITFFNIAGLYVMLGAEFLAAIQVLVYAGAIVVLFLFVMMLLQVRPGPSLNRLRFFQSRFGPILAVLFLLEVLVAVFASSFALNGGSILNNNNEQAVRIRANTEYSIGTTVPITNTSLSPARPEGGPSAPGILTGRENFAPSGHTAIFGKELYSTYIFPFEVASLILLIAAIGAIVIARRNLEQDTDDGIAPTTDAITLTRAAKGSAQDEELRKRGRVTRGNDTREERLTLKK